MRTQRLSTAFPKFVPGITPLSAALLAGGRSTRMGRDKCLVEIDGVPLWRRQLDLLAAFSDDILVVTPAAPAWLPASARWVRDAARNAGPLGGLVAALAAARHEATLILAVDLPGMTAPYLDALCAQAIASRGVAPFLDDRFQPLSAIYPRAALPGAQAQLGEPDKSLQRLLRKLTADGTIKILPVAAADRAQFRNLNSPAD